MTDQPWGFKLVGPDLSTDDHRGGRFRYRLGSVVEADPGNRRLTTGYVRPAFPGDGLCVARTLQGAQSGGARLNGSVLLLVSYEEADVLASHADKVRVRRLTVHDETFDPVTTFCVPGAYLSGAYLSGADLSRADLSGADLSRAYLSGADLSGVDLSGADLSGAYLSGADLSRADLSGADLSGADLSRADLSGADLSRAYLSGAYLSGVDLSGAYLSGADLSGADLSRADLSGADLSGADLSGAYLSGAYLSGARGDNPPNGWSVGPVGVWVRA